jgi:hypothetical protein
MQRFSEWNEALHLYVRPFRIGASVIGILLIFYLIVNFAARKTDISPAQWCGGRPVEFTTGMTIQELAHQEGTKTAVIRFCNLNLLWDRPDTIRIPRRWWTMVLVFAFLLMLACAWINKQRFWGLYLFLFILALHKMYSGPGWSFCFGEIYRADANTSISAIADATNSSAVAIHACNLMGSNVLAGAHITIPTTFGIGFAVILFILMIVPPLGVGMGRWFGSKDEARRHGVYDT